MPVFFCELQSLKIISFIIAYSFACKMNQNSPLDSFETTPSSLKIILHRHELSLTHWDQP